MDLKPKLGPNDLPDWTFKGWLKTKPVLLKTLLDRETGGVFPIAKKFQALMECEESEEVELERRSYGLAPPPELRCLVSDSETRKDVKRNLWRCVVKGYCTRKESKETDIPPFRLHLPAESKCWDALAEFGFYRHDAGPQFICVSHLRAEGEILTQTRPNSSKVLRHWMLYQEMLPGAEVQISTSLSRQDEVRESVRKNEKCWFLLRNRAYKSQFPPRTESHQTPTKR